MTKKINACGMSDLDMLKYLKDQGVKYIISRVTVREDLMNKIVEKKIFVTDKGDFEFICERIRKRPKIPLD